METTLAAVDQTETEQAPTLENPSRKRKAQAEPQAVKAATLPPHPLRAMRKRSVPLVGIETADPAATVKACRAILNGSEPDTVVCLWDFVRGLVLLTPAAEEWFKELDLEPMLMVNPSECLKVLAAKTPTKALFFISNAHLTMQTPTGEPNLPVLQAVWNCRDQFAARGTTLVLLAPTFKLTPELAQDVVIISEPAPTEADIEKIVESVNADADLPADKVDMRKAIDGLTGYLSAFSVAQAYAISLTEAGPDYRKLWELKVQALKQTAGLEITLPTTSFENMAGCASVKAIMRRHLAGKEPPRAVLWLDEIEKMLAAGNTDTSGTTQAVLEQFLYWTQARRVKAFLLAGIPGAGKSLTCQAVAGEAKCPLLRASLSTVKGQYVGNTEENTTRLFKAVDAVAQGRVLMLATCNSLDALSPEVMSRFNMGMFFYDYPTPDERTAIVEYYRGKYQVDGEMPAARNWVGREIEACFEKASLWNISLAEAGESVVPAAVVNKNRLDALRQAVSGRFLSAARPGLYNAETVTQATTAGGRKLEL